MSEVAYFVCSYCTMMLGRILRCWTPADIRTVFPTHHTRIAATRVSCSAKKKKKQLLKLFVAKQDSFLFYFHFLFETEMTGFASLIWI